MTQAEDDIATLDAALARLEGQLEASSLGADSLDHSLGAMGAGLSAAQASVGDMNKSLSGSLKSAMRGVLFEGEKLSTVLTNLAQSMVMKSFNQSIDPITDALSNVLTSGVSNILTSIFPFAKGGVVADGRVQPFARGVVISSPMTFPMRGGTGLMGEVGPEAIMPLSRGPDGRLGVQGGTSPINFTMHVSTPDAASFNKSKSQIAAGLTRALQAGRRNL